MLPHARFEADLHEGDSLVFPPGWTHATRIVDGPSVATSHNIYSAPPYASMPAGFTDRSPLGYEYCIDDSNAQWRAQREK